MKSALPFPKNSKKCYNIQNQVQSAYFGKETYDTYCKNVGG